MAPIHRGIYTEEKTKVVAAVYGSNLKKDLYRREGKGRRCCLVDSIPSHASYFAPGRYEDKDEFQQDNTE